ncbi:MAG: NAD/NADP octopine/nopaline dehydrogenase family protein [Candidatus Bathyarchaeia archaeon]|nr:NAD/NADP octopine/nopaline dehydrogenase family protein [Candidatus Bathyarchaeota archaeon]
MNVAVLGAGNGGYAASADLSLAGFKVNLYESKEFEENLKPIIEHGGIEILGSARTGFARLNRVTTSIKEAIEGVDLIMVVVPAFAHKILAKSCAPYLKDQPIVLNPGHTGGALEFFRELRKEGFKGEAKIGETMTLTYICRKPAPAQVKVFHVMKKLLFGVFPSKHTEELYGLFKELYPSVVPASNVLESGLTNLAAMFHPPGMLLNSGWIEFTKGNFKFYYEGITPSVARVVEALDQERLRLMEKLGFEPIGFTEWYYLQGCTPIRAKSVYEALQAGGPDQYLKAPNSLEHRYVVEELNHGLVPIASIARMLNSPAPNIEALIVIASTISQRDYWKEGLTVEKLGIAGLSLERLEGFLKEGKA